MANFFFEARKGSVLHEQSGPEQARQQMESDPSQMFSGGWRADCHTFCNSVSPCGRSYIRQGGKSCKSEALPGKLASRDHL